MNADLKQGMWTILGFLLMLALLIPVGGCDQWRRAHPQLGRYEIVATGTQTVVKLDTATGTAWLLRDFGDVQKWARVEEDTVKVWRWEPTADGKGKLVPEDPSDPLGIK